MEILEYIISTCIGGALVFLGNYLLEDRRRKNDQFKYTVDKMVTVGEDYYKFSSYSLIYFTSLLDTLNKRSEYNSDAAHRVLDSIDEIRTKQIEQIQKNNETITTASFYFNVTDSNIAVDHMLKLQEAGVKMHHSVSIGDIDQFGNAADEYKKIVIDLIQQIKDDQLIITRTIQEKLNIIKKSPDVRGTF